MFNVKGLYEWKLTNAETGALEQEGKQWNVISDEFLILLFSGNYDNQLPAYYADMAVQLSDTTPDPGEDYRIAGKSDRFNILSTGTDQSYQVDWDAGSKYCDHNFTPPGSPVTIRVIGIRIDNAYDYNNFVSFIELSTPITQNTSQYLYVKYTVFVSYSAGVGYNTSNSRYLEYCMNVAKFGRSALSIGGLWDTTYCTHFYVTDFLPPSNINYMERAPTYKHVTDVDDFLYNDGTRFGAKIARSFAVDEINGPIGTITFMVRAYESLSGHFIWAQSLLGYSQNKDNAPSISRVFSHPQGREDYVFSDPSFPASSQGSVLISGTPTNKFTVSARVRITKTGDATDIVDETVNYTAVNTTTDEITVSQDLDTGDIFRLTTTGALPSPLVIDTDYYAINIDATHIQLATSYANAIAGTEIVLTTQGTGDHTLIRQNTGQYNLELSPWPTSLWRLYNLSMAIDFDGYVMPQDLDATTDYYTNYAEGDYIASGDTSASNQLFRTYGSSMIRGTVQNGNYIYSVQQSRKGLINNVCRWLFNTIETSQPLCKFGTGTTEVSALVDTGTKMYICTNEGVYEYTFATPTVSPTSITITGLIDTDIIDACLDPVTGSMWTGHTTGMCKVNLGTLTATQYTTGAGQALDGMTANEARIAPGQLDVYNGRVLKGGESNIPSDNLYSAAWVLEDGVGYYRVNGTGSVKSCCMSRGTNQVIYRGITYIRTYTVTVTGVNAGTNILDEEFTGLTSVSDVGAHYGQMDTNNFMLIFSYSSSPYNLIEESYRIGSSPVEDTLTTGTTTTPYYRSYSGTGFSWCMGCLRRNKVDVTGSGTEFAIWHRYIVMPGKNYAVEHGWNGATWEKGNTNSRNIPKTATHTLLNGLSVDFNNATGGATWDQQYIDTEFFSFGYGPVLIKDNLQTLDIKTRHYFCQAQVVESYGVVVPSSAPYEVYIPEVSDPNFRDLDCIDYITEVFEGATEYTFYNPAATTYTADTGADILNVGTSISTGTPIIVFNENNDRTSYLPYPLKRHTVYYAINDTATTIRLALSYADALTNTYINITSSGSYTNQYIPVTPSIGTYRHALNGVFVFSALDAGKSINLTYTYTKFTT